MLLTQRQKELACFESEIKVSKNWEYKKQVPPLHNNSVFTIDL